MKFRCQERDIAGGKKARIAEKKITSENQPDKLQNLLKHVK